MNSSVLYSLIDDSDSDWEEEVLNEQISSEILNSENEERERWISKWLYIKVQI